VLGTDLVERNLVTARAASYGAWSRRTAGPILHPLGREDGERLRIDDRLREVTRFEIHNLLHAPPPGGPFDVIFCRNALVYFAPDPSRAVVGNLVSALAPEGVLCFGPMDFALAVPPPGLVPASKPEEQIWHRPEPAAPPEKKLVRRLAPPAWAPPAPRGVPPPEPVVLHLRALRHIERGERQVADQALAELCRLVPGYVPGLVEHALLKLRNGEQTAAAALMREVLRRLDKLPAEELVPGPEPLPVGFYRESAGNCLRGGAR
jgi:SAM-dependent methyltransferase